MGWLKREAGCLVCGHVGEVHVVGLRAWLLKRAGDGHAHLMLPAVELRRGPLLYRDRACCLVDFPGDVIVTFSHLIV